MRLSLIIRLQIRGDNFNVWGRHADNCTIDSRRNHKEKLVPPYADEPDDRFDEESDIETYIEQRDAGDMGDSCLDGDEYDGDL